MMIASMRLEMHFEKTQRVDSRAATLADGRTLFGVPDGQFSKHGC